MRLVFILTIFLAFSVEGFAQTKSASPYNKRMVRLDECLCFQVVGDSEAIVEGGPFSEHFWYEGSTDGFIDGRLIVSDKVVVIDGTHRYQSNLGPKTIERLRHATPVEIAEFSKKRKEQIEDAKKEKEKVEVDESITKTLEAAQLYNAAIKQVADKYYTVRLKNNRVIANRVKLVVIGDVGGKVIGARGGRDSGRGGIGGLGGASSSRSRGGIGGIGGGGAVPEGESEVLFAKNSGFIKVKWSALSVNTAKFLKEPRKTFDEIKTKTGVGFDEATGLYADVQFYVINVEDDLWYETSIKPKK